MPAIQSIISTEETNNTAAKSGKFKNIYKVVADSYKTSNVGKNKKLKNFLAKAKKNRKKIAPFIAGAVIVLVPVIYFGMRNAKDVSATAYDLELTTGANTIQIDVPNRYRAIMTTNDTEDYIEFYDRGESDTSPDATHELKGPCFENYCLRDDDERLTTIVEVTPVRIRIKVSGRFNRETATNYRSDGGGNDITVDEYYTFTQRGVFVENNINIPSGLTFASDSGVNGYNWLGVFADKTDAAYDDGNVLYYGDGSTENTSSTDGDEWDKVYRYVVLPGTGSGTYQDAYVGIANNGWYDDDPTGGAAEWRWDEQNTGTEDLLVAQEQAYTSTGQHTASWYLLFFDESEMDTEVERESLYNDYNGYDTLTFYDTGSAGVDGSGNSFNTGENAYVVEMANNKARWSVAAGNNASTTLGAGATSITEIELSDSGHYFVHYNLFTELGSGGSTGQRRGTWGNITIDGTPSEYGWSTGYLRDSSTAVNGYQNGAAIIDAPSGGELLKIGIQRYDDNSSDTLRLRSDASGIGVLKLDDDWDYLMLGLDSDSGDISTNTSFTAIDFDRNDEVDTGSFGHSESTNPEDITLIGASGDKFLVNATVTLDSSETGTRQNYEMRLSLGGAGINGTTVSGYMRSGDSLTQTTLVYTGIITKTSASPQTLNIELRRESETSISPDTTWVDAGKTTLSAVALPNSGVDYFRVTETATDQNLSTTRTAITFNSTTEEDTGTFDHDSAVNLSRVTLQQDANILVFGQLYNARPGASTDGTREEFRADFQADGTTLWEYGGIGGYNRGSGGNDGALSSGAAGAAILHDVSSGTYIELTQVNEATDRDADYQATEMSFQGINLDDLLTTPAYEVYSLSAASSDITSSQTFITWDTNELSSGGGGVTAGDTVIEVNSTAGFPNAGVAYIGEDKFSYTNTTATTFTGIPSSGDLAVGNHSDGEVVSLMNRHDPTFKFQNYRSFEEPEDISVGGQVIDRSNYTMGIKPFSNAYFTDNLVFYSTLQNSAAITSPDVGDGTGASVAASFTSGKFGNGLQVNDNADDTYIAMDGNIPTQTGTIEFWYEETNGVDAVGNFFSSSEGANQFELRRNSSNTSVLFALNGTTMTWTTNNIYDNESHHIRFSYDTVADVYELFVDGQSMGQNTTVVSGNVDVTGYNLYLGMDQDGGGDRIDGVMDELRIYDTTSVTSISAGGDQSDSAEYLADESNDYTLAFNAIGTDNEGEYLFLAADDPFYGVNIDLATDGKATAGTNLTLQWQYWNGTSWEDLTVYDTEPGASNLTLSGNFYFSDPGDWEKISIYDPNDLYYIRAYLSSGTYDISPVENLMKTDILLMQHVANLNLPDMVYAIPGQYSAADTNKGSEPVAHWLMDDAYGALVRDRTASANDLTVSGATWQTETTGSQSARDTFLRFDGVNDRLIRTDDGDFNFGAGGFTYSGWFRHTSTISGTDMILAHYGSRGYKVYMNSSGYICFAIDDDSSWSPDDQACSSASLGSLADSTWHHFAAVKESNTAIRIYIDGVEVGNDTNLTASQTLNTSSTLHIGIDSDTSSNPWSGDIDNIILYPYARSEAQVKTDYNTPQTTAEIGKPATDFTIDGLVGHWKMDESSGNANDSSGNGLALTNVNSTSYTTGKLSFGGDFESSSSNYQYRTDNSTLSITGELSMSAWINPESNTAATLFDIMGKWDGTNESYLLAQYGDEIRFYLDSSSTYLTTDAANLSTGTWYHVMATYDPVSTSAKIFVNGNEETSTLTGTIPNSIGDDSGRFHIGAEDSTTTATNFYDGVVDDVRLYNRTLNPAEVKNLYIWKPNPQGYWDFNENTGTTTVYDKSHNTRDGIMNGSMTEGDWVPGKIGSALDFDGSDDYLQISNPSLPTNDFSYTAWVHLDSTSDETILMAADGSGNNEFLFEVSSNTFNVTLNNTTINTGNTTIPTNDWVHLAVTRSEGTVTTYVNGNVDDVGSDSTTLSFSLCQLLIGTDADSTCNGSLGNYANGRIDEVKIYNYARTQGEIVNDMRGKIGTQTPSANNTVAYYKFDEMYGDTANDSSGLGQNGDLGDSDTNCPNSSADCPSWTPDGKYGGALNFDGTDDYINLGNNSSGPLYFEDMSFSFSAWIKPDTSDNSSTEMLIQRATFGQPGYEFGVVDGVLQFTVDDTDVAGTTDITSGGTTWYYVTAVYDQSINGGQMRIYVDGNLEGTGTETSQGSPWQDLTLGAADEGSYSFFDGIIDEFKIYNYALTDQEIANDFNAGSSANLGRGQKEIDIFSDGNGGEPVLYLDFNENTGTSSVFDKSGNGFVASMEGSFVNADWVPGKIGSALEFDANNEYLEIADNPTLRMTNNMSISVWLKPRNFTDYQYILEKGQNDDDNYALLMDASGDIIFEFEDSGNSYRYFDMSGTIEEDVWTHVVFVFNDSANTATFYINGIPDIKSNTRSLKGSQTDALFIGEQNYVSFPYEGYMDELKIYDYALTNSQVAYEYNRGKPLGWWALDDCTGTTAADRGPHNNDGTITIGSSGTNTSEGSCRSGTSTEAWNNGTTGKYEGSLSLDGTDDYINIGNPTELRNFSELTITAWVKGDAFPAAGTDIVFSKDDVDGYELSITNQNLVFNSGDLASGDTVGNVQLEDDIWYHVAATYDGSTVTLYVNGTIDTTEASIGNISNTTDNVYIGASAGTSDFLDGQIDDVRIYNYALSPAQIKQVYNFTAVQFGYD